MKVVTFTMTPGWFSRAKFEGRVPGSLEIDSAAVSDRVNALNTRVGSLHPPKFKQYLPMLLWITLAFTLIPLMGTGKLNGPCNCETNEVCPAVGDTSSCNSVPSCQNLPDWNSAMSACGFNTTCRNGVQNASTQCSTDKSDCQRNANDERYDCVRRNQDRDSCRFRCKIPGLPQ
ncbi:hypothetical protein HDV00_005180 [Rhizophlyctis rosea]|nr:hypothetical protein HDV00_005180 [Rhizophlyctis rosea]